MFASRLRTRRPRTTDPLGLDTILPEYDATVCRHVVVEASPVETYEAVLTTDLTESGPVVTALNVLRFLPGWFRAVLRRETPPPWDEELTLAALPTHGTWVRLVDEAPREFVFGAIGRVWKPDIEWATIDDEDFRRFEEAGYAKIAAGISVRPYGSRRSLVTYEARTVGTDAAATQQFRRYWTVVKPFAGYIMARALRRMKLDAETRSVSA